MIFKRLENFLDAIERRQNQRDCGFRDRHAVTEFAHQALGSMRERRKPRQTKKAACAFDGVNKPENIGKNFGVVRLLLKAHELDIDGIETLMGLGQKIPQQLVHCKWPYAPRISPSASPIHNGSVLLTV
jgi:hypothetical protein